MTPEGESRCVTIHDTLRFLNLCVCWWAVRWDFEVAKSVFYDSEALIIPDPDHSAVEQRFVLMGQSSCAGGRVVVNCYRAEGFSIRIISARRARTK